LAPNWLAARQILPAARRLHGSYGANFWLLYGEVNGVWILISATPDADLRSERRWFGGFGFIRPRG
jgi:hypothetical protein